MSATVSATPAVEAARKPLAEPGVVVALNRAGSRVNFERILSAFRNTAAEQKPAQAAPVSYKVKSGDTLSAICAGALRESGGKASRSDIMAAVKKVATANGLANADRISVGQQLDLSAIGVTSKVAAAEPTEKVSAQGGGAIGPAEYGLAVLSEALSNVAGIRGKEATSVQRLVAGPTRITSEFGLRKNPFNGRSEYHSGIDIAATAGAQVYPVKPGEVTFSGWKPGYGKVVIVSHGDGTETFYAHNQRNLVAKGQQIGWNTPVAKVGSTGDSTGPHIHFEVRRNGHAVNPTAEATASLEVAEAF